MNGPEAIAAAVDYARAHPDDPTAVAFLVELDKLRENPTLAAELRSDQLLSRTR